MAAAAASSPSPDPAAAPPPAASSNPHRPSAPSSMPPSAHLRPPAFAAKPLTSPPPNKSALDSANRAAMRALSGPTRPHTALDQPIPSAYIRRTSPTVAAATPFPPRPQSALVHMPVRQMQPQPQTHPQPQPQSQPRPLSQPQPQLPSQPHPHPQPQPQPQPQPHLKIPVQQVPQAVAPRPAVGGGVPSAPRTIPVRAASKVASFPITSSAPEFNSCKDRERRDDSVVMIHNRKVRLLDGGSGSLYALCRSWIRNGSPQDCLPSIGDGVKLLPRPLPAYSVDSNPSERSEGANDAEDLKKEEHVGSAEQLSTQDLLAGLVKRSKRVRAQLRKERVRRIARYNQRLSLLLPPVEMGRVDAVFGS